MKVVYYVEEFNEMIGENGEWETIFSTKYKELADKLVSDIRKGLVEDKYPEGMYRITSDVY